VSGEEPRDPHILGHRMTTFPTSTMMVGIAVALLILGLTSVVALTHGFITAHHQTCLEHRLDQLTITIGRDRADSQHVDDALVAMWAQEPTTISTLLSPTASTQQKTTAVAAYEETVTKARVETQVKTQHRGTSPVPVEDCG
jgi:hypothetical protein